VDSCTIETKLISSEYSGAKSVSCSLRELVLGRRVFLEYTEQPQLFKIFTCKVF